MDQQSGPKHLAHGDDVPRQRRPGPRKRQVDRETADDRWREAAAMDIRKLRGTLLRVHYSFLRLVAANKKVLETYQEVDLVRCC